MPLICYISSNFTPLYYFVYLSLTLVALERLISAAGCSLSAGRAVSLLGYLSLRGLTCPATPAGASHLPSNQLVIEGNQKKSFKKSYL
jgi:hypothetical protein